MRTILFKSLFAVVIVLPILIAAQGRTRQPNAQQEQVLSAMLNFERQIRRFYQSQVRNLGTNPNLANQTLIPCSKIEEASSKNDVTSVVQIDNLMNWMASLEECLVLVLRKVTSANTVNVESRIKVVEHTLGRYGIITIEPRFGGQTEELLGRIWRLEKQVFKNNEDNVNNSDINHQLLQRLEQQENEIKVLKDMVSKMSGTRMDVTTANPIPVVRPGVSTLTINEIVDRAKKRSALHLAAENGDVARLTDLLQKGANTDLQDSKMWTPLHLAAWRGHGDAVRLLLDYGADIEARDQYNYTALHWAAQHGNVASVKVLLEKGADKEAKDNNGETPLHKAAWEGKAPVMEALLKSGANPNSLRNEGYTPLHLSIHKSCVPCVKTLLSAGVDIWKRTDEGEDAMKLATNDNNLEIIQLLRNAKLTFDIFGS